MFQIPWTFVISRFHYNMYYYCKGVANCSPVRTCLHENNLVEDEYRIKQKKKSENNTTKNPREKYGGISDS